MRDLTVGVANMSLPVNKFTYMCQHPVLCHFCLKKPDTNKVKKPLKDFVPGFSSLPRCLIRCYCPPGTPDNTTGACGQKARIG